MQESLKKSLNIDKTNWTSVTFGDVVFEPKGNAKDIYNEGIEHVVGLEHIGPEDIHLRRSASIDESTTFSKKFRAGDVLFGRRRAYLKKAALAHFDGICSGDITVFRAKENILPELVPFIVNNEKFFNYAVKHSAGGLSPRVKFKDLANYEILLPPKDQQAKLAKLLWAMDEVIEREREVLEQTIMLRKTLLRETYVTIPNRENSPRVQLNKLIKLSSGKTRPKKISEQPSNVYIFPVYGGNGIIGYSNEFLIDYKTIILGRVGEYCGVVHDSEGKAWISDNALYVKEFLSELDVFFLSRYLEFIDLNKQQSKSSHPLITQSKVCQNLLPILTDEYTRIQNQKIMEIEKVNFEIHSIIKTSKALQKSLINQIF